MLYCMKMPIPIISGMVYSNVADLKDPHGELAILISQALAACSASGGLARFCSSLDRGITLFLLRWVLTRGL